MREGWFGFANANLLRGRVASTGPGIRQTSGALGMAWINPDVLTAPWTFESYGDRKDGRSLPPSRDSREDSLIPAWR